MLLAALLVVVIGLVGVLIAGRFGVGTTSEVQQESDADNLRRLLERIERLEGELARIHRLQADVDETEETLVSVLLVNRAKEPAKGPENSDTGKKRHPYCSCRSISTNTVFCRQLMRNRGY